MKHRIWTIWPALLMLLLLPALAYAQSGVTIFDELGQLNQSRIRSAAEPIIDRGGRVAVYLVRQGSDADFARRLQGDNLLGSDGRLRPGLVAIYVGTEQPRISAIRFEDLWNTALGREINGRPNWENIRAEILNPGLSQGDFTGAFVDTLEAVEASIASPPEETPINTAPIGYAIGGAALLGVGAAVGVPLIRRRRQAQAALAGARQAAEEGRTRTGAAIADTGRLLKTVEEKAAYDKLSYPPDEVSRLAAMMQQAKASFNKAQTDYDDVGESILGKQTVTKAEYDKVAAGYKQVLARVEEARKLLEESEQVRAELERRRKQAGDELDRLKKA